MAKRIPVKLNIVTNPTKTEYVEDLPFNVDGLTLSVTYDNEKTHSVDDFDYPTELLALGQTEIELAYTENSTKVTVEQPIVITKKVLQSIAIRAPPTKTEYIEDTKFDKTGLIVEGLYNNNKRYPTTAYTFDTNDLIKGATKIELSYNEDTVTKTVNQPITVKAKTPTDLLVKIPPKKIKYIEETVFDKTGMVVHSLCDNGKEYPVTSYTAPIAELDFSTKEIKLSYAGKYICGYKLKKEISWDNLSQLIWV
ncbi:MAG: hypothetical protein WAX04_10615 [Oscillospiraceae bacterium]